MPLPQAYASSVGEIFVGDVLWSLRTGEAVSVVTAIHDADRRSTNAMYTITVKHEHGSREGETEYINFDATFHRRFAWRGRAKVEGERFALLDGDTVLQVSKSYKDVIGTAITANLKLVRWETLYDHENRRVRRKN